MQTRNMEKSENNHQFILNFIFSALLLFADLSYFGNFTYDIFSLHHKTLSVKHTGKITFIYYFIIYNRSISHLVFLMCHMLFIKKNKPLSP